MSLFSNKKPDWPQINLIAGLALSMGFTIAALGAIYKNYAWQCIAMLGIGVFLGLAILAFSDIGKRSLGGR